MNRIELTGLRCQSERSGRDTEKSRGVAEVEPRLDAVIGGLVDGNAVMRAQRGDALTRPAVAVACHQSVPVQDTGNEIVIGDQRQLSHRGNHVGRGVVALSTPSFWQA